MLFIPDTFNFDYNKILSLNKYNYGEYFRVLSKVAYRITINMGDNCLLHLYIFLNSKNHRFENFKDFSKRKTNIENALCEDKAIVTLKGSSSERKVYGDLIQALNEIYFYVLRKKGSDIKMTPLEFISISNLVKKGLRKAKNTANGIGAIDKRLEDNFFVYRMFIPNSETWFMALYLNWIPLLVHFVYFFIDEKIEFMYLWIYPLIFCNAVVFFILFINIIGFILEKITR